MAENSKSRQRLVRVPIEFDDWLIQRFRASRSENPDSRNGVSTEINKLIREAYEADSRRSA